MVFETAKKQRSTHLAQLTRLYKDLEKHMVNKENKEKVDELYLSLCSRYEHFKTAHFTCVDNCENSSVIENLEESYKSQKQNYDEFKEHFKRWNDDCDNESDIGSVASSRNQIRSAKIKRMIAENKMKTLKERMRLEHQQREIENRKQMLDIESEIEEARIEESVWEDDGNEHDSKIRDVEETQRRVDVQNNVEKETRLLSTSNTTTTTTTSEIDIAFNRLANTLQEGFNLPKPEILTFDGNVLDYCKSIKNFETNVESKVSDNRLRLSYLIQYCTGEAKSCIEDCVLMDSNEGYEQARSILCSRYGRSHVIARTCIDKLLTGPQIQASDVDGLSKLALDMQKCQITLSQLGFVSDVDNSENLRKIVRRLPLHLRTKWADTAHSIYETGKEPCFKNLMKFVDERARVARSIYGIDVAQESSKQKYTKPENWSSENVHRKKITTLSSFSEDDRECGCCSGKCADLSSCRKFTNMKLEDRQNFVVKNRLCFNCLKRNHMSRKCRKEKMCKVSECSGKHHTLLHSWTRIRDDNEAVQPSVNCATSKGSRVKTCLGIIPVKIQCKNGRSFHTHALLDDGADKTLCDERLLKKIGCTGKRITFQISTVNSTGNDVHGREVDLNVSSAYGDGTITIKNVWTVKKLPISLRSAATIKDIRNVSYLSDIQIPDVNVSDVMLLIGTDAPEAHIPVEVRSGNEDQPYAIRSKLGWAVRGPIGDASSTPSASVNFQQSSDNVLQEQLERLWTTDFRDGIMTEKECMSVEDTMALDKMKSSIVHQDGHYKMDLPWRDESKALPNDLPLAQARLTQLKRKLSRDPKLHEMYSTAMNSYIENGYATEVDEPSIVTSKTWYLPHHPVLNANKPGKVRVVFDCAAKYKGISLNSQLLQGPDLMNNLVGVVIRFRQEKIALAADIEAMFHQVNVTERDCDSLRFLWWPNGDMNKPLKTYCMRVHLFGATSSPSCTAYALKRTASDNRGLYEEDVIQTVEQNFYVDDCLKSVPCEDKAIQLAENLQSLMKRGGFRLTKWLSNSRKVLNAIPESERAPSVINLGPNVDLPCDRALGVGWDVNKDTIQFNVKITEKPPTRRGLLSIASSIFDPLGYVAPITLRAKAIIQSLCRKGIGWDEDIPAPERSDWNQWLSSIPSIGRIQINRCYKPTHFQEMKSTQLHLFCDGSEAGYGACAYIRLEDVEGNVVCPLVIGKSRLAPIKQMSIPRLELSAATLACQLYGMLSEELELDVESVTFWTDSTIVLGYINNMTTRFKTFVGNRLRIIHDATKPSQWTHVDTDSNPADIASRGISGADTEKLHKWLYGPSFLLKSDDYWPRNVCEYRIPEGDVERKKNVTVNATVTENGLSKIIDYFSDWKKLRRCVAWLLRFQVYCVNKYVDSDVKVKKGELTVEDVRAAERALITHVQYRHFQGEIEDLNAKNHVKKDSKLASLNPIIENGLIRVQGRRLPIDVKTCPIIVPQSDHISKLIIRHIHETHGHVGREQVLAILRRKYWILRGPSVVKRMLGSCIVCKRAHAPLLRQQMAPLLKEQMTPNKPPFTYVGIDYFGPLMIKTQDTTTKRYGCLFTCLTTRAVHLEVAHTLTTESFLAAFQRFVSRRGLPEKVYSDYGTNLVSGDRELRRCFNNWNQSKIGREMVKRDIEWHFNPPSASHMGGLWERLIRSTRTVLKSIVKEQLLNDEQLLSLMTETENILNSRPITQVSRDHSDPLPLTPNMLLMMKSESHIPYVINNSEHSSTKQLWKQTQYLINVFWRRWIREYLPTLQKRQKWRRLTRDLRAGDLVLVADDKIPRGQWPMGVVEAVRTGRDGHVRSCVVKTKGSKLVKPVTRLCLLEGV